MHHLLLATRNAHKTREFAEILGQGFHVRDLTGLDGFPPIEETGRTFAENAKLKALAVAQDRQSLVIADDSGLEVDALNGAPGIYSARYAGENATDEQNIEKLLRELAGRESRKARFRCVIALARNGKLLGEFEGTVEGAIVDLARGRGGFGYDPVFRPDGFDKTFGELPAETKNRISHRAKAIAALRDALSKMRP
jgi:XTP/dITP diphosphohydrolase